MHEAEAARLSPGEFRFAGVAASFVRTAAGHHACRFLYPNFPQSVTDLEVFYISTEELLINEEIRDREVRVIDAEGNQLGIMPTAKALELAEEAELDLVRIVPGAQPPVCKLMDYDKHRFEQSKRERELRKNQKVVALKEVQLSATIEENDIAVKAKAAVKFLEGGDKVKVSIRFRGRQITHSDIGLKIMNSFAERIKDYAIVERRPTIEGRNMMMILVPKTDKAVKASSKAEDPVKA